MVCRPASKAYRDQQRKRPARFGAEDPELTGQLVLDWTRYGCRPWEAWRLARQINQKEAAAQFKKIRSDPSVYTRGRSIDNYENWPTGSVRPSIPMLNISAIVYRTAEDSFVDIK